uniref:testis-expressed protein 26-like n=1 Tax=Pristiophorus japonicus TaxID=55135 RepID=UPI00398F244F
MTGADDCWTDHRLIRFIIEINMKIIKIPAKKKAIETSNHVQLILAQAVPRSSNGYTYPYQLQEPIGDSSYTKDYPWKCVPNQQPMQSGALWGCGKNNVDPCQSLMLWNLLKKDRDMYDRVPAYFVKSMSSEDIAQVEAYQYNTVYRQDYLGMQQEFQMKCPPCLPNIGRTEPCYPLTDNQYHYRKPNQKPELAICTSRYGSNKHWKTAAKGIVPRAIQAHIQKQENRKHVTTYERDYGRINMNFAKILNSLEPKAFKSYLESLSLRDQDVLLQFLDTMM